MSASSCTTTQTEALLVCGLGGAGLGALLGDDEAALWGGVGAAAMCFVVATELDRRREEALTREQELVEQIKSQVVANAELEARNSDLEQEIASLNVQAKQLASIRRENQTEAAKVAARIKGEQASVEPRIALLEESIQSIDNQIKSDFVPIENLSILEKRKANLEKRIELLRFIELIEIS